MKGRSDIEKGDGASNGGGGGGGGGEGSSNVAKCACKYDNSA